ncbi:MAG TPA: hypothetical protein VFW25_09185 [Silvibacterium sp.]|nr:hypothetical protein [Silvibacterium sp.]
MKACFSAVVPLCCLFASCSFTAAPTASAQDQSARQSQPPNVLEVIVEYVKPGQAGTPHQKTEGAFAQAMRDAKWQSRYIGMTALTGRLRSVFFVPYNSFADWQKDTDAQQSNTTLAAALDSATVADGALLEGVQTSALHFRADMSLRPGAAPGTHFFEATIFHIRSGHEKDWDTVVKMYKDAFEKNVPDAHWDMFEQMYGTGGGIFVLLTPMRSLDEVDNNMMNDKKIADALGPDQMGKMRDLASATADIEQSNLLAIDPKMSYPPDSWVQSDAQFWNRH